MPTTRQLSDFTNADGSAPDGKDNKTDDTSAMRKALAAGPGIVHVGAGFYRFGDVTVPKGVTIVGAGPATVIRSSGPKHVFVQKKVGEWCLRDLVLDGEAEGDWTERKDKGQAGIYIHGCLDYNVIGVVARNFAGAGVQIEWTAALGPNGWNARANLDRITAVGNYIGVRFDVRAEYINATKFCCQNNVIGVVIHGGNVKLANSNITSNITGIFIEDKDNGSHGAISNCLVNHNHKLALHCRNVGNGMLIDNCCFFRGGISLENCKGVSITNGIFKCPVKVTGKNANRIAGNYVIAPTQFNCSPATILQNNYTEDGPINQEPD